MPYGSYPKKKSKVGKKRPKKGLKGSKKKKARSY